MDNVSLDSEIVAAAKVYSSRAPWVEHSKEAVEYLTIINEKLEVLFTNHLQPGVESAVGLSCLSFLPPGQQEKLEFAVAQTLNTGLPWHFETEATGPNGAMSWYSGWATVLGQHDGGVRIALIGTDVTHVRRVEEELEVSDETFRSVISGASDYITIVDRDHKITFINHVTHVDSVDSVVGQTVEDFVPEESRNVVHDSIERVFNTGSFESYEIKVNTNIDGSGLELQINTRVSPIYRGEEVTGVTLVATDVTQNNRDRLALRASEDKLRQSQQLQAVGQLTGGIAHDFNNLLMVMQGSLQLAKHVIDDRAAALELLDDALEASKRAADLTQRLLAFGRRQSLQPATIGTSEMLASIARMMRRTLGSQVEVLIDVEANIWDCFADRLQLESAILNLGINARDALGPDGGSLLVQASNYSASEDYDLPLAPGDYLRIDVSDNGPGIDEEVAKHVFEPFFTTKDVGHGSGLGLSMVYGFAQQSGGHVSVESVPNEGTMITLFLPRGQGEADERRDISAAPKPEGKNAHVFVVEDVPEVAKLTRRMLELYGYRVNMTDDAAKALDQLERLDDVEILLTDVGLPGPLNGVALAREVRKFRPDIRVLYMTGYDNGLLEGDPNANVVKKPFAPPQLAAALEEVLK